MLSKYVLSGDAGDANTILNSYEAASCCWGERNLISTDKSKMIVLILLLVCISPLKSYALR